MQANRMFLVTNLTCSWSFASSCIVMCCHWCITAIAKLLSQLVFCFFLPVWPMKILQSSATCPSPHIWHSISFDPSFLSLACSDVWVTYVLVCLFLLTFSFLSVYSFNASFENKGSFTKTTSSYTNSIRLASSGSLCSCLLRFNTHLFHLFVAFPGSLDIRLQSTSGVSNVFHSCRDMMLSHLMRKL